jgi:cellobiose-specific phosphotransferase system component IIB
VLKESLKREISRSTEMTIKAISERKLDKQMEELSKSQTTDTTLILGQINLLHESVNIKFQTRDEAIM